MMRHDSDVLSQMLHLPHKRPKPVVYMHAFISPLLYHSAHSRILGRLRTGPILNGKRRNFTLNPVAAQGSTYIPYGMLLGIREWDVNVCFAPVRGVIHVWCSRTQNILVRLTLRTLSGHIPTFST